MTTGGEATTARQAVLADLVARHCAAEVAQDIEAVLATVGPEPWFELHPLGLALSTRGAVAEFYRRMLPAFGQMKPSGSSATYGAPGSSRYLGDDAIVTRDEVLFQAEHGEVAVKSLALFQLDATCDLLKGEQIFLNANAAALFARQLGDDFDTVPGVVRLPDLDGSS